MREVETGLEDEHEADQDCSCAGRPAIYGVPLRPAGRDRHGRYSRGRFENVLVEKGKSAKGPVPLTFLRAMIFGTPSTALRSTASGFNRAADPASKTFRGQNQAAAASLRACTIPEDTTDLVCGFLVGDVKAWWFNIRAMYAT